MPRILNPFFSRILYILISIYYGSIAAALQNDPSMEFIVELKVKTGDAFSIGKTMGGDRYVIPIVGGSFEGPRLKGEVLKGGADYQTRNEELDRTDLDAIYCIQTNDGVNIQVRNSGMISGHNGKNYFYTAPRFEAPADSKYAWLNHGIYICRPSGGTDGEIWLKVWRITDNYDFDSTIGAIDPIPDHIYDVAEKEGKIETFTYEADIDGEKYQKKANVYLPYGYNPKEKKKRYNVVYLMHGGGDNISSFLSPGHDWLSLKNVLDHLIAEKRMEPVIVVTPTFYNDDGSGRKDGMNEAVELTRRFHAELHNDLIPTVEKAYNTYFNGKDSKAIENSREHRAFGGFSMGALVTWYQLAYGLADVKYFIPLSGDCWLFDDSGKRQPMEFVADWLNEKVGESSYRNDFQIFAYSGTNDIAGEPEKALIKALDSQSPKFSYGSASKGDIPGKNHNIVFSMKKGGEHYYGDINRYLYYALPLLFK